MPEKPITERPWEELTGEEQARATAWAEGVAGLADRVARLDEAIAAAEARQAGAARRPPPVDRGELAAMGAASEKIYKELGKPDGYRYGGGPVAWDKGES